MTYWVSCKRFTVMVETDPLGKITSAAPIVRKFTGQPLSNLINWARDFGDLKYEPILEEKP